MPANSPKNQNQFKIGLFAWMSILVSGCAHDIDIPQQPTGCAECPLVVPATRQWTDTGIDIRAGESITASASGSITFRKTSSIDSHRLTAVGPTGTYLIDDDDLDQPYPLHAGSQGPAPACCLIGRINNGEPFYVGANNSRNMPASGRLFLGINDFDVTDNEGSFHVSVSHTEQVQPISFEKRVTATIPSARPHVQGNVVVFYVDGLRPDVVREMASMGHLPNINRRFIQNGCWLSTTLTAFPSDTITSNGTMWTGCFSDRHGLKGQVRFSRRTLLSDSYLEPLGPNRSARLLSPQGIDKAVQSAGATSIRLAQGEQASNAWVSRQTSPARPLYERLREQKTDWATGVLPVMTDVPPLLWTRSMTRHVPYLQMHNAWQYVDDANTHYALRHLLHHQRPVTIIWLPETDSVSHKKSRGQFGVTRRTIAEADVMIGKVTDELERQGRLNQTYFVLVSDHGHHGGRRGHLSHFDLANELFYAPRELDHNGSWVSGGLGLSVRQHRIWNRHSGDGSRHFVFIDGASDGAARVFLPRGRYDSDQWQGTARPGDLLAYKVKSDRPPINLISSLTSHLALDGSGQRQHPIDLAIVRVSDNSVLISTADRGHAVIDRRRNSNGSWEYRYSPVDNISRAEDGGIAWQIVLNPNVDPLGIINSQSGKHGSAEDNSAGNLQPAFVQLSADRSNTSHPWIRQYHTEADWLDRTAHTNYPDGVVALTRHMLWQSELSEREQEFAPDIVVTARAGWYFGQTSSPGSMHGYPFPDAMNASLFISGPGIRRNTRIEKPCRLVDLTPTILEMTGIPADPTEFDGHPFREIYEPVEVSDRLSGSEITASPLFWSDVDLGAWNSIPYRPLKPYQQLPLSINHPENGFDLNNLAYNAISLGDLGILRILDDVIFPITRDNSRFLKRLETLEMSGRRSNSSSVGDAIRTLDVPSVALSDYNITSSGNLKRVDHAVDWIQARGMSVEMAISDKTSGPANVVTQTTHQTIDAVQWGFWETYRFTQRVLMQWLDEKLINNVENQIDRSINWLQKQPAEIRQQPTGQADVDDQ